MEIPPFYTEENRLMFGSVVVTPSSVFCAFYTSLTLMRPSRDTDFD